ncbi:MAG: twin-arginine translocation signal domain-containing protein [Candidatus Hydrogenedens sp.]|nr:twin-arginine translocation signal domain-containing protein [Candidatus Hydrogenedentota bacterium]NLF57047.1 twin-arginine translocation signal domain-containing protein [Candidatus Hydrogenedens sp.]
MDMSRRNFLRGCAAAGAVSACGWPGMAAEAGPGGARRFNLSVSIDALKADPELMDIVHEAGVTDLWLACFFNGHWHHDIPEVTAWRDRIRAKGMAVHNITIPLGHPSYSETPPDYMPGTAVNHWKQGVRPDGKRHFGVSLHPPATEENVAALGKIKTTDPGIVFLDDDFRLAPSPDDIGGCFCDDCKKAFLETHGYSEARWGELLADVADRRLTDLLRAWVEHNCDKLTGSFRAQQAALAPEAQLGNMVMYMGAEKAGIRLPDYTGAPFRVGELMFSDDSFAPVKGKTNELFSALFHRRFTPPELAYSETTAWPPDKLSAPNMAAKLAVSTLADVRNTMFMSGTTPFPRTHWATLAPAMKKQAALHRELAGHAPRGPFRHYWGEAGRCAGDSNAYSLFLALGVPFEVDNAPGAGGWTFLSDADARHPLPNAGTTYVHRPETGTSPAGGRAVAETLDGLFAFKHELMPLLAGVPVVEEDAPVVCAWYPTARAVLLWNLSEDKRDVTLLRAGERRAVSLGPLDTELVRDV